MALHDPGFVMFDAEVRQDQSLADARSAMLTTLDAAAGREPITEEEVDRARASILKNIELTLNNAERVGLLLSEYIGQGDWRLFFLNRDRVRQATVEDVRKAAASYLKASNRTVGVFLPTAKPDRAEVAPPPDVAAIVKDYKGDAAIAAGEAFDPSPANLESRTKRSKLPGGMKMALLPKKTRGRHGRRRRHAPLRRSGEPRGQGRHGRPGGRHAHAGNAEAHAPADPGRARPPEGAHERGRARGPGDADLRDDPPEPARRDASRGRDPAGARVPREGVRGAPAAEPGGDRGAAQRARRRRLERLRPPHESLPERATCGTSKRSRSPSKATRPRPSSDARTFYGDYFGGSNGQLAIVGDFDEAEVSKLSAELFGDWKSPATYARIPQQFQDVAPANESLETPDKANAYFVAGQNLKLRDDDPDYPALIFGNFMLGVSDTARLYVRIREKEGLSYGVGSQLSASPLDASGAFTAFAIYAPQNAARLEAAFREELARVLGEVFPAKEVAEAKSGWLQSRQITRSQDASVARMLAVQLYLGRNFEWDAQLDARIQALTGEQVLAAMRRHIDPAKMTMVKAGDFAKAKASP